MRKVLLLVFILFIIHNILPTIYFKYFYHEKFKPGEISRTFDDGPNPETTPEFLKLLEENQKKARFFLMGNKVEANPAIAKEIEACGQKVGFHCYRHYHPTLTGPIYSYHDFKKGLKALKDAGLSPQFYRPPHGEENLTLIVAAKKAGLKLTLYNSIPRDRKLEMTYEELMKKIRNLSEKGGVVCLHDSNDRPEGPIDGPLRTLKVLKDYFEDEKTKEKVFS